jgi:hypothetical protein
MEDERSSPAKLLGEALPAARGMVRYLSGSGSVTGVPVMKPHKTRFEPSLTAGSGNVEERRSAI